MAFYIEMDKIIDTEEYADYSFGRDSATGIIRLDKVGGTISVVEDCPLDATGKWAERAAMKLARLCKSGVLSDKTQWAS